MRVRAPCTCFGQRCAEELCGRANCDCAAEMSAQIYQNQICMLRSIERTISTRSWYMCVPDLLATSCTWCRGTSRWAIGPVCTDGGVRSRHETDGWPRERTLTELGRYDCRLLMYRGSCNGRRPVAAPGGSWSYRARTLVSFEAFRRRGSSRISYLGDLHARCEFIGGYWRCIGNLGQLTGVVRSPLSNPPVTLG